MFVVMGDGRIQGLKESNYQDVIKQNNHARKAAGAPAIELEAIGELFKEPYQPGLEIEAEK